MSARRLTIWGLDGDVERRNGLVADDQVRLQGEGARDADALALAARELVRQASRELRIQPDDAHEFPDPVLPLPAGHACLLEQGLGDGAADAQAWIQRRVGVLEDHLHARTEGAELRRGYGCEIDAVEDDSPRRGLGEPQDAAGHGRLAAAALLPPGRASRRGSAGS